MSDVSIDLFVISGTTYVVMVDRYSGWPFYSALTNTTTESLWRKLCSWFYVFGFPLRIRSDGGPQFRQTFASLCSQHGISHELASAYNPTSNACRKFCEECEAYDYQM